MCAQVWARNICEKPHRGSIKILWIKHWVLRLNVVRVIEGHAQARAPTWNNIMKNIMVSFKLYKTLASERQNTNSWSGFQPNILRTQCRAQTLALVCPESTERMELWFQWYLRPIQVWNSEMQNVTAEPVILDTFGSCISNHRLLIVDELQLVWSLLFWLQQVHRVQGRPGLTPSSYLEA